MYDVAQIRQRMRKHFMLHNKSYRAFATEIGIAPTTLKDFLDSENNPDGKPNTTTVGRVSKYLAQFEEEE